MRMHWFRISTRFSLTRTHWDQVTNFVHAVTSRLLRFSHMHNKKSKSILYAPCVYINTSRRVSVCSVTFTFYTVLYCLPLYCRRYASIVNNKYIQHGEEMTVSVRYTEKSYWRNLLRDTEFNGLFRQYQYYTRLTMIFITSQLYNNILYPPYHVVHSGGPSGRAVSNSNPQWAWDTYNLFGIC